MTDPEPFAAVVARRAPVQDRTGIVKTIPWEMHLRAYTAYCKKWGPQAALIDLEGRNCRGGFSTGELDDFIPGWRDELPELETLAAAVKRLTARAEAAERREREMRELLHWALTAADRLAEVTPSGILRTGIRAKADEIRLALTTADKEPDRG